MRNSTIIKLMITAAVVVGGLGFLVYTSTGDAQHYRMVDALMSEPARWVGKEMRIHGWVEPGSIHQRIEAQITRRDFVLAKSGKTIAVTFDGPAPDTFRDQAEVVALGTLVERNGGYVFEAKELMAKCPSKYEGSESNKKLGGKPVFE